MQQTFFLKSCAHLGAFLGLFALGACSEHSTQQNTTTAQAAVVESAASDAVPPQGSTVLKVAVDTTYPPFGFRDENARPIGFDVDLLSAVAKAGGFQVSFDSRPWGSIFSGLKADEYDIVAAAVTITPERQQSMDFSDPYIESEQMAVVRNDNQAVKSFADLLKSNAKVSVKSGTISDDVISNLLGADNQNIVKGDTSYLNYRNLLTRKADVVVGDSGVMRYFMQQYAKENLRGFVHETAPKESFGFVVKKGRTDLQKQINEGLKTIKANGTYDQVYAKWFANQAK